MKVSEIILTIVAILCLLTLFASVAFGSDIEKIERLSGSRELATYTYESATRHDIDPLLLAALIWSESRYIVTGAHRKGSKIKGLGGIHTGIWKVPNDTPKEQVEASAYVLRVYLDKYGNNELKALKGYKGWSKQGERHARVVLNKRERLKND